MQPAKSDDGKTNLSKEGGGAVVKQMIGTPEMKFLPGSDLLRSVPTRSRSVEQMFSHGPQIQDQGVRYNSSSIPSDAIGPQAVPNWLKKEDGGAMGQQEALQASTQHAVTQDGGNSGGGAAPGNFTALSYSPESFVDYTIPANSIIVTGAGAKKRRRMNAMAPQPPLPAYYAPMEWMVQQPQYYSQPMQWMQPMPPDQHHPHPQQQFAGYQHFEPQWSGNASFNNVSQAQTKIDQPQQQRGPPPQSHSFQAQVAQAFNEHVLPGVGQAPTVGHWFQTPHYLILYMPLSNFGGAT